MSEMSDDRRLIRPTTVLLADEDIEMLRDLARRRAQIHGGRLSQGGVLRDLLKAAHGKHFPKPKERAHA